MFSGISIWQLLILLAIVVLLFGTKKLRNIGGDLGGAVKGFKSAMKDGEDEQDQKRLADDEQPKMSSKLSRTRKKTRPDSRPSFPSAHFRQDPATPRLRCSISALPNSP